MKIYFIFFILFLTSCSATFVNKNYDKNINQIKSDIIEEPVAIKMDSVTYANPSLGIIINLPDESWKVVSINKLIKQYRKLNNDYLDSKILFSTHLFSFIKLSEDKKNIISNISIYVNPKNELYSIKKILEKLSSKQSLVLSKDGTKLLIYDKTDLKIFIEVANNLYFFDIKGNDNSYWDVVRNVKFAKNIVLDSDKKYVDNSNNMEIKIPPNWEIKNNIKIKYPYVVLCTVKKEDQANYEEQLKLPILAIQKKENPDIQLLIYLLPETIRHGKTSLDFLIAGNSLLKMMFENYSTLEPPKKINDNSVKITYLSLFKNVNNGEKYMANTMLYLESINNLMYQIEFKGRNFDKETLQDVSYILDNLIFYLDQDYKENNYNG